MLFIIYNSKNIVVLEDLTSAPWTGRWQDGARQPSSILIWVDRLTKHFTYFYKWSVPTVSSGSGIEYPNIWSNIYATVFIRTYSAGTVFIGTDFIGTVFIGTDFTGTVLIGTYFTGTVFIRTDFNGTGLTSKSFRYRVFNTLRCWFLRPW